MSRSTDPGHFFQTDASEAIRARRAAKSGNTNGNPIKLQSKILDITVDPSSEDWLYIAESAGSIRRVNFKTRDIKTVYRGPTVPLTSVTIGGNGASKVFAGCWDKDIWSWERSTMIMSGRYKGHADFVKAVISVKISGKDCLISGSADSKIMVWDTATGERIHSLRDKNDTMRAVQYLAIDPVDTTVDEVILLSASSDPKIRRWRISLDSADQIVEEKSSETGIKTMNTKDAILEHDTSVYKLLFDSDEGDLWTASADGTTKCLSRAKKWVAEETIQHGDFVKAVEVTPDWIVTAGRDEDVKIWDRSTGKLFHTYAGHFEEVTGLLVVNYGKAVVSVSIDGTLRTWPLGRAELEKARVKEEEKARGLVKEAPPEVKKSLLTEEEEAELAELMDSH